MKLRAALAVLVALLSVVSAGCGKQDAYTKADTEGVYLRAGGLNYQIQLSRALNPAIGEDADLLHGVSGSKPSGRSEEWFGIWLHADNPSQRSLPLASNFSITDTQGNEYRPVTVDTKQNILAYRPGSLPPGGQYPPTDTPQYQSGPRNAGVVLFRLPYSVYQNRPLELNILSPDTPERVEAKVELDL